MSDAVEYHAYIIGADGFIIKRINLFCADDEAAKEQAGQMVDGYDVELWRGAHMVAAFAAKQ